MADSIFTLYKEVHPPTCVDGCTQAHFMAPDALNLIIAKASLLQIYLVVEEEAVAELANASAEAWSANAFEDAEEEDEMAGMIGDETLPCPTLRPSTKAVTKVAKLELVAQYRLHGVIAGMETIQTNTPGMPKGQESLILTFKDAKMSLLEWSSSTNSLVTVSIHYYEKEEYMREFMSNTCPTDVRVDPQGRCAVMHFYGDRLAILPFKQEEAVHLEEGVTNKWPYLPSFVIAAGDIDPSIKNILDMAFLIGFFEPTLAILFEATPTWTGRLAVKKDTCSLAFVSMDVTQKIHTVIYRIDDLPSDSYRLIPVPKPISGVLVLASNAVIHVNQSTQSRGIAVNAHAANATAFPHLDRERHATRGLRLDSAQAVWLKADRLLLSLRSGELYVLELESDDGRSVARFGLSRVGASVLPSCACRVGEEYLFLGSRLGDSLLLKYEEVVSAETVAYAPKSGMVELDQELYGEQSCQTVAPRSASISGGASGPAVKGASSLFYFTVCDSLLNIGPISDFAIGEAVDFNPDFLLAGSAEQEIVACSGHGSCGAISVLQRAVTPQILSSLDVPDCLDVWPIRCARKADSPPDVSDNGVDRAPDNFVVISRLGSTLVLAAGEELKTVSSSGFYTQGPTIAVGSLLGSTKVVQVYADGLQLLNSDLETTQFVPIVGERDVTVAAASINDPYVLIRYTDGSVVLMKIDEETKDLTVCQQPVSINNSPITACTLSSDDSGLFVLAKEVAHPCSRRNSLAASASQRRHSSSSGNSKRDVTGVPADDADLDLYGDKDTEDMEVDETGAAAAADENNAGPSIDEKNVSAAGASPVRTLHFCLLCRADGAVEIYTLPDFHEVFCFPHFDLFPGIVSDTPKHTANAVSMAGTRIEEVALVTLGRRRKSAYLFASTTFGELVVYEAFRYQTATAELDQSFGHLATTSMSAQTPAIFPGAHERLAVRFARIRHDAFQGQQEAQASPTGDRKPDRSRRRFVPFADVGGYSGIFVNGAKPHWALLGPRRFLRLHPMRADGEILCFSPLHVAGCPNGFLYVNAQNQLRICQLPTHVNYDLDWPVQKLPMKRSTHFIAQHFSTQTYALSTSHDEPFVLKEENAEAALEQQSQGLFLPLVPRYTLELVSPVTWETVDRHFFSANEHVLCLKACELLSKQTASGRKLFLVAGTAFNYGEDVAVKGYIYVFDVIEVVPEPDNPQTNHKFKMICSDEVKGPVGAVAAVNGNLLTCIGSKVIIRSFEDNESLTGIAFIDAQMYTPSVSTLNNCILLGDAYKSIWFLGFQEEPSKITLLGKDWHPLEIMTTEFLIDGTVLYFVVSDTDNNIHLFSYSPYNVQAYGGNRLIRRGDLHVGSRISQLLRLKQRASGHSDTTGDRNHPNRHTVFGASLDGSLCIITPVEERTYRRFHLLHAAMVNGLQHPAGLNPRAFRLMHSNERLASNATKGILDGDLLFLFPSLALNRQREMTKQIGSSVKRIIEDLMDVSTRAEFW